MPIISLVAGIAYTLLLIYFFLMWTRFIIDLARGFSRQWRPKGMGLVLAESVLTLTDPPIRMVRRVVPSFRIGPAALDLSWSIVMLVVIILMYIAAAVKSSGG